jgi:hypothetical protein
VALAPDSSSLMIADKAVAAVHAEWPAHGGRNVEPYDGVPVTYPCFFSEEQVLQHVSLIQATH